MSSKVWSICGGLVALALMTVVVGAHGCGSNSSSSSPANFMASCETACNRELACMDASSPLGMGLCMSACAKASSAMTAQNCPNLGTQVSMANTCLAMQSCTGLEACLNQIPGCQGGNGSGGSGSGGKTGSGGATGTGGSGAGNCSTCAKSHACCLATNIKFGIPDGSGCDAYSEAQCTSLSGAAQTQYIDTCSNELVAGDTLGVTGCQAR
jgi:hypothetical protein